MSSEKTIQDMLSASKDRVDDSRIRVLNAEHRHSVVSAEADVWSAGYLGIRGLPDDATYAQVTKALYAAVRDARMNAAARAAADVDAARRDHERCVAEHNALVLAARKPPEASK